MEQTQEPPVEKPIILDTYIAKYGGTCDGCALSIMEGQRIYRLSTDEYVHFWCL